MMYRTNNNATGRMSRLLGMLALVAAIALSAVLVSSLGAEKAHAVTASNGAQAVVLKQGQTNYYDITGDGKADKIQVICGDRRGYSYGRITVKVNDSVAFSKKLQMGAYLSSGYGFSWPAINYLKLKNGKPYLFLSTPGDNDDADVCGVFRYKSGKLQQVINCNTFYGSGNKYGMHKGGSVKKVSGNSIIMNFNMMSWMASGINADFTYKYKGGTLKKTTTTAKLNQWGSSASLGTKKAEKKITVYKSASCKAKKFTIKKGQSVKLTKVYVKGGLMTIQVKAGGKTGWIKCAKTSTSSLLYKANRYYYKPPFKGVNWAG